MAVTARSDRVVFSRICIYKSGAGGEEDEIWDCHSAIGCTSLPLIRVDDDGPLSEFSGEGDLLSD